MKLTPHGGFGEKGRTCLSLVHDGFRLLLDVGINTSGRGDDIYPEISPAELARTDALIVTHTHEDHIGALGWAIAHGFSGVILMTAETRVSAPGIWASYATPDHARLAEQAAIQVIEPRKQFSLGPFIITTGRSGHIAGGVWLHVSAGGKNVGYCGDIVPDSPVFPMDAMPAADALIIDASYGDDDISFPERAAAVRSWTDAHPGCAVPTPLEGRSLELMAILAAPFSIAASMRAALAAQIANEAWIRPSMIPSLLAKLHSARDWRDGDAPPPRALLCDDGMGLHGPSRAILTRARDEKWPTLFTGHLPTGSPGAAMRAQGEADWLRLPTHPILQENIALVAACAPRLLLGHSAERDAMNALARHIPLLAANARVGDVFEV